MERMIFILGCGEMQIPALKLSREQGWRVAAADGNPDAPGRLYCDEFYNIDLKDTPSLVSTAKNLRKGRGPNGVFTAGTDFSHAAALVASALGLPGHRVEAAFSATDKIQMRKAFSAAGVPSPSFAEITADSDLDEALQNVPGPWVVKPVDSMGARGVVRIDETGLHKNEILRAIECAGHYSRSRRVLVETYVEGPEFSLDALIEGDRIIRCGLADRIIRYPPYFVEIGHTIPSAVSRESAESIWKVFEDGINALGLTWGAAKGDIKLTPRGPVIGEIAARLSGGYMSGWTWPEASGVQPTLGGLYLSMGLRPGDMSPKRNLICAERALTGINGTVRRIDGREDALKLPGIQEVFLRCKTGDTIKFPVNNVEKAGSIIAVGDGYMEVEHRVEKALQALRLILEPSDRTTGDFLDSFDRFPPDAFAVNGFFDRLWQLHPPCPSEGSSSIKPPIFIPMNLPKCRDYTGRTMEDVIYLMEKEDCLSIVKEKSKEMDYSHQSSFWKALVRGSSPGLRWFLEKGKLCRAR